MNIRYALQIYLLYAQFLVTGSVLEMYFWWDFMLTERNTTFYMLIYCLVTHELWNPYVFSHYRNQLFVFLHSILYFSPKLSLFLKKFKASFTLICSCFMTPDFQSAVFLSKLFTEFVSYFQKRQSAVPDVSSISDIALEFLRPSFIVQNGSSQIYFPKCVFRFSFHKLFNCG